MFFAQAFLLLVISSVMALPGGHFHSPHPYGHNGHVHDNGDNHDHDNGDDADYRDHDNADDGNEDADGL